MYTQWIVSMRDHTDGWIVLGIFETMEEAIAYKNGVLSIPMPVDRVSVTSLTRD